ncbi:hypothetical protein [Vibrio tritonius]|uniref:hypothetical protein n=1 Tax=Vibrio tritonius TaxID=1435069 RepID=UPI0012E37FB5|nr:hypothetical protein [Vibrio tritonius]
MGNTEGSALAGKVANVITDSNNMTAQLNDTSTIREYITTLPQNISLMPCPYLIPKS